MSIATPTLVLKCCDTCRVRKPLANFPLHRDSRRGHRMTCAELHAGAYNNVRARLILNKRIFAGA